MKFVKRIIEEEIPYLWPLKQYLLDEGIVKKRNNTLSLTKNGKKLLESPQAVRFIQIFNYLGNRFHWGNFYGNRSFIVCRKAILTYEKRNDGGLIVVLLYNEREVPVSVSAVMAEAAINWIVE